MSNQIITTLIDGGNIIGKVSGFTYSSVQAELETKATKDYVDGQDALKADKTYTDAQLAEKALKTEVGTLASLLTTAKTSIVTAINELFNSKANKVQEAWITPTLLNGWVDETPSTGLKFRKNGFGQLEFLGNITGGAENTVAFILPSGYIPPQMRYALVVSTLSFGVVYFTPTTGQVQIRIKGAGLSRVSFDNVIINI